VSPCLWFSLFFLGGRVPTHFWRRVCRAVFTFSPLVPGLGVGGFFSRMTSFFLFEGKLFLWFVVAGVPPQKFTVLGLPRSCVVGLRFCRPWRPPNLCFVCVSHGQRPLFVFVLLPSVLLFRPVKPTSFFLFETIFLLFGFSGA